MNAFFVKCVSARHFFLRVERQASHADRAIVIIHKIIVITAVQIHNIHL